MPLKSNKNQFTDQEALQFHAGDKPGKLEIRPTKPMATQRDLSLAYSPGVAVPVEAIAEAPGAAYDYTNKGNMVAVISNGTAILGLGNLGALASKPVMEGKSVLFKRFADVDSIDLEVDTEDPDAFINCVRYLGPAFGGINLEDIKAPDCFIIEQRLRELMDIPVFHDDQHGTAIIATAGLINALHLTGKNIKDIKLVCSGAGAAAISCVGLAKAMGLPHDNAVMVDRQGVVYKGREEGMDQWKSAHAVETKERTLEEALKGADVFYGLSAGGIVSQDMVKGMANQPVIFAMANPEPEIRPEAVAEVRSDAIMATGRSDYSNQVNNVLGFPYIFRGALDVHASEINEEMKIAAATALAHLAREDVPDEVAAAYHGQRPKYGPDYIIPAPFDPRLISHVPPAVAKAAMDSGVARSPIVDMDEYKHQLSARLDPVAGWLHGIFHSVRKKPKRMVFAEGEQTQVIRAANSFYNAGLGTPILIGRQDEVMAGFKETGIEYREDVFEIQNARDCEWVDQFADYLYERLQRKGYMYRDCRRMANTDRVIFGASMVAHGYADAMVAGVTRNWSLAFEDVMKVLDVRDDHIPMGVSMVLNRGKAVMVSDTSVHDMPTAEQLADIAVQTAQVSRRLGAEPRVAMLAYSTFGHPKGERSDRVREAVQILDGRDVDFEYEGEMAADVALSAEAMAQYPFCRLSDTANVLIMPAFHSASIATKMLQELSRATVIGPLLVGLEKSVQLVPMGATDNDIVNMAAVAAYDVNG